MNFNACIKCIFDKYTIKLGSGTEITCNSVKSNSYNS